MNDIIEINNYEMLVKEYKGQRVVTFKDIDMVHGRPDGTARRNFNTNKKRFVEDEDFFVVGSDEIRSSHLFPISDNDYMDKVLLTEQGYLMLVKSFTDDLAWEVQRKLIKSYFYMKEEKSKENLETVNETVKIFTDLQQKAGCSAEIQLLTAKTIIEQNTGIVLPIMIQSDKQYYDTTYMARKVGIYVKSSGKPAEKAVNEIIRKLNISEDMYTETWETNGKWQGTVRKYAPEVIEMVKEWCRDNGYPDDIEYVQTDGKKKCYHVIWKDAA